VTGQMPRDAITAEQVARLFHEAYERLAPSHGYETRKASAVPWDDVPEPNRSLMIAVAAEVAPVITAQATQDAIRERVAEQHAVHEDLAMLLRVLGLGDHARPKSSHEVMLDAINEAGKLRQAADVIAEQATAAERERWARKMREMAAAILPEIRFDDDGRSLAAVINADFNSPAQVQGRLLLQLADLLDGGAQ
jgi:hypothetical protein